MKKILIALCCMLGIVSVTTAQTAKKKAPVATQLEKAKPAETSGKHLKKDGTADKRFKENKATAEEVRLKKDGTPDKRFKKSKTKKG